MDLPKGSCAYARLGDRWPRGISQIVHTYFTYCTEYIISGSISMIRGNIVMRTKYAALGVILDGLKRNMSRGNSLSDELDLSSVLGDTRAYYLYSPVLG